MIAWAREKWYSLDIGFIHGRSCKNTKSMFYEKGFLQSLKYVDISRIKNIANTFRMNILVILIVWAPYFFEMEKW